MLQQNITILLSNPTTSILKFLKTLKEQSHKHIDIKIFEKAGKQDGTYCWQNPELIPLITCQTSYSAILGKGTICLDLQKTILETNNDFVLWIDGRMVFQFKESLEKLMQKLLSNKNYGCIYSRNFHDEIYACLFRVSCMRQVGYVDVKYTSTASFALEEALLKMQNVGYDVYEETQLLGCQDVKVDVNFEDVERFNNKKLHPLFGKPVVYIDGALGDHVCAIPLVRACEDYYVCCKYSFIFNGINSIKGFVLWTDEFFGGDCCGIKYEEFADIHRQNVHTISEAYCQMYGMPYRENNFKFPVLQENVDKIKQEIKGDKIVCLGNFASIINNKISNKNFPEIRWFEVVDYLKKFGFTVCQIGSIGNWKLPNVDYFFCDRDVLDVSALISISEFCICVDSFIHHFSSAVGTKCLLLSPDTNEHAFHKNNINIFHEVENKENREQFRYWLDSQQPLRAECMKLITVQEVKEKIIEIVKLCS